MLKWFLRTMFAIFVGITAFVVNTIWFKPYPIRAFYERVFLEFALESPELLSNLRLFEQIGITGHNAELDDASEAKATEQFDKLRKNVDMLHSYDTSGMTGQDKLSYDILDWFLATNLEG